jgi:hypothetical protein
MCSECNSYKCGCECGSQVSNQSPYCLACGCRIKVEFQLNF